MRQTVAPVISNTEVMPETHLIWLECPEVAAAAQPGQFVMVRCGEDALLRRPLSVHQVDGNRFALLFEVVGKGTCWLSRCQTGYSTDILGPLGKGYAIYPDSKNLLLLAGGIGIAPLLFLALSASKERYSIRLLIGARTAIQLLPTHLLPAEIDLVTATEDGTTGKKGMITDFLPEFADWADQILACGPLPMYKTMAQMPEIKGKSVQISLEVRMGCGLGVCYGCTVKTKRGLKQVCQDGPVFGLDDILWEELPPI